MGSPAPAAAPDPDERALVARAVARDQDAFRVLVERHRDRAYALALRILRSSADAEEVAQDAFVRAWLALPGFRFEASFGTWLYRIVARRAFDRAAVLRGRRARETDLEAGGQVPAAADPAGAGEWLRTRKLERLIAELPETQRAVLTLYYYEDRAVEEVARTLDMNENTVKTHLSRARAALRRAWQHEAGEERP
jgi:RNA polymerase sigma-70 factor (ECF subfamily)